MNLRRVDFRIQEVEKVREFVEFVYDKIERMGKGLSPRSCQQPSVAKKSFKVRNIFVSGLIYHLASKAEPLLLRGT